MLILLTVFHSLLLAAQPDPSLCLNLTQAVAFRTEISVVADSDSKAPRRFAWVSALRGTEAEVVDEEAPPNAHIISLGSGPDVFRPIFDFPKVENIHLADIMTGWGTGPHDIVEEISSRLASLGEVKIIDEGFSADIDFPIGYRELLGLPSDTLLKPLIWEVKWRSPSEGPQKKRVYLHPLNFRNPVTVSLLLESIPDQEGLWGTLLTGVIGPSSEIVALFQNKIAVGGYYIDEYPREDDPEPVGFEKLNGRQYEIPGAVHQPHITVFKKQPAQVR